MTGLLGVLRLASFRSLIDLPEQVERLRRTSYYLPEQLVAHLLKEDEAFKKRILKAEDPLERGQGK